MSKVGVPLKRAVLEQVMPVVPSVVGDSDINDKLLHFIDKNIPIESEKEQKVGPHLRTHLGLCPCIIEPCVGYHPFSISHFSGRWIVY
jgi:hypothetical protein